MKIAPVFECCILKPVTLLAEVDQVCIDAQENKYRAVCVPPLFVKHTKNLLKGTPVLTATAVGFPFGYSAIEAKLAEAVLAMVDGADEIELVINTCALKNADWQYLAREVNTIMPVIKSKGLVLKVIIETALLTNEEMITCCDIYGAAGVDYVKTSTGFSKKQTSIETIVLFRKHLADQVKIVAMVTGAGHGSAVPVSW